MLAAGRAPARTVVEWQKTEAALLRGYLLVTSLDLVVAAQYGSISVAPTCSAALLVGAGTLVTVSAAADRHHVAVRA